MTDLATLSAIALGIIIECMFYGAYVVLFILYLVLWHRNNRSAGKLLAMVQIFLFSLCTVYVCLDISASYSIMVLEDTGPGSGKLVLCNKVIFAMVDYLAQMNLVTKLYRCWIIWSRRWAVVAIPGFLALVTLGGGFALAALSDPPHWDSANLEKFIHLYQATGVTTNSVSLAANALTTSLIVTKILVTSREVRPALGSNTHQSLRIAIAMLIESGLLIFSVQLVYVVLLALRIPAFDIFSDLIIQIYGITPILLNIRVVMGSAYDETTEKTRSLRFAHSGRAATQTTGLSMSAAGVRSTISIELGGASNSEGAADSTV